MSSVDQIFETGSEVSPISVSINYDIIRLFSEGLYRSPHKAVEELVSNSYDAGATSAHIILPDELESDGPSGSLWVVDNGSGMDEDAFHQLWKVAESNKTSDPTIFNRPPIGQFGIGKLAAYVLASRITHISHVDGNILLASMDFSRVKSRQVDNANPVKISLRRVQLDTIQGYLEEIKQKDPSAWSMVTGEGGNSCSWTIAVLSNLREIYGRLSTGMLRWVISTGLPLYSDFRVWLDGDEVTSSKAARPEIKRIDIDQELHHLGKVAGEAVIYEDPITGGRSQQLGRSNGFFVRVRGRVINLEDELFGVTQPNHAAWSRFAMDVHVDGLRDYLLSSREGVKDSEEVQELQNYMISVFNECRNAYQEKKDKENDGDLLSIFYPDPNSSMSPVIEPLLRSVARSAETQSESFYVANPLTDQELELQHWIESYQAQISETPWAEAEMKNHGPSAPSLRYDARRHVIEVNLDHPFVSRLTDNGDHLVPAKLFAAAEVLIEGQLDELGIDRETAVEFAKDRDRVLRMTTGGYPPTATLVLQFLDEANEDPYSLEKATGAVFSALGFEYQRRGGNAPGTDGVLYAKLGRHRDTLADYRLVYDAKQTGQKGVPAGKCNFSSLEEFRSHQGADFGFFVAAHYQGEANPKSKINRNLTASGANDRLSLLTLDHLKGLVGIHYRYGLTLTEVRCLFEEAHTVPEASHWIEHLATRLNTQAEVPVRILLDGLEIEKKDPKSVPNVAAVRAANPTLRNFELDKLVARLKAVENIVGSRWIEVDQSSYSVRMHTTADQVEEMLTKNIQQLPGIPNMPPSLLPLI